MAYIVHILGEAARETVSRQEAVWELGSKYGNSVLIEGKKNGAIVWTDTFVKVNPLLIETAEATVRENQRLRGLSN